VGAHLLFAAVQSFNDNGLTPVGGHRLFLSAMAVW
jgi:hypothetical protein